MPRQIPIPLPIEIIAHSSVVWPYECAQGRNARDLSDSLTNSLGFSTKLLVPDFVFEEKFKCVNSTPEVRVYGEEGTVSWNAGVSTAFMLPHDLPFG